VEEEGRKPSGRQHATFSKVVPFFFVVVRVKTIQSPYTVEAADWEKREEERGGKGKWWTA